MAVLRKEAGQSEKVSDKAAKKMGRRLRHPDDHDVAFEDQKLYVLDEGECFDPHTSTKDYDIHVGGRHAMLGPAAIIVSDGHGSLSTNEFHVNDPHVWNWLCRVIKEGYLDSDSVVENIDSAEWRDA